VSWRSVERAKGDIGVISEPDKDDVGKVRGWRWRLPTTPPPPCVLGAGGVDWHPETLTEQGRTNPEPDHTATSAGSKDEMADWTEAEDDLGAWTSDNLSDEDPEFYGAEP
jgi:hypothetical protein